MAEQHSANFNEQETPAETNAFEAIRRRRLIQISGVTALGLLASLSVARSFTFSIFGAGLVCLVLAIVFAYNHRTLASAYTLLGSMAAMLFALALTGAGVFDLAMLGFPGLMIFAAILGGGRLFLSVQLFIIAQCAVLTWLTLQGVITPHTPRLSWAHLIFMLVIFVVIGFSVYILVRDIKRLMRSLQSENAKVQSSREKIEYLAHHDPLTGLPNRLYGESLFSHSLASCEQADKKLALLFIDLDNFKPVNDALGHEAGDALLQKLTRRLKQIIGETQHLIRFGGDEFLVFVPFNDTQQDLNPIAEALIDVCSNEFEVKQNQIALTASMGIAHAPAHGTEFKQLCRKADLAMYRAKEDGRNTYHHYDDSLNNASDEKFRLIQKMRPAIEEREFTLHYQPMVCLKSKQITTVEALLRWPQPDGSMIPPDTFVPVAESSGLINELGRWVLEQACAFCAHQRQNGFPKLRVAVNISVVQFKSGQLNDIVEQALTQACLPGDALELELTESLLIEDNEHILHQLTKLTEKGIAIAIDDFGTGYSNLAYLRKFNASRLKIDRSFIQPMSEADSDTKLISAIIQMAASMGMETVAEGIEDEGTLNKLSAMGCDIGQGYYWSPPVSESDVGKLLKAAEKT